eukprot:COSAG01_NODE_513_length_16049_cov_57.758056_13_plen_53_part_00
MGFKAVEDVERIKFYVRLAGMSRRSRQPDDFSFFFFFRRRILGGSRVALNIK